MSPFRSKAQQGAAFSGALGPEMKSKAKGWAKETPNLKNLPQHVGKKADPENPTEKKSEKGSEADDLGNVAPSPKKSRFIGLGAAGNPMAGLQSALKKKTHG